jgi:hypothetical protein
MRWDYSDASGVGPAVDSPDSVALYVYHVPLPQIKARLMGRDTHPMLRILFLARSMFSTANFAFSSFITA